MTLQQYLDAIAASSDPYAKIPTSQYDSAGGYSERAYLLRLSDLCHFDGSPLTGGPDPYEFGWWTGDPVAITGKTNVVKDKERAANAAAQARRSNTKTASTPAWHTQVIRVKAAGKSWLSTITANDSNDNAAYADGIWSEAPPDGSNHPKYFYAWVRLSQNAYCRQFRWCLYGDLLVPVGARDIYNPLTNPIADWLSGIEQIGGFIGAVFTGGAALAVYLVNTIIDETGALVPIPGASDILKLAEKAAQAEG